MAISFSSLLTQGTGGTTSFSTASVAPLSNHLIILCFYADNNANASPTVSGCNLTWTKTNTANTSQMQMWQGIGASPTSGAISVSSLTSSTQNAWQVIDFGGVLASAPIKQNKVATGSGTTLSVTLTNPITSGNAAFGFGYRGSGTVSFTPGGGFTEIAEQAMTGRTIATEYELNKTDDAIIDMTISSTGTWYIIGAEIEAAPTTADFFMLFD